MRALLSIFLLGVVLVSGCGFVRVPEPTLGQVLGVNILLPMPETEFLELMHAHSIDVERRGHGSPIFQTVPASRQGTNLEALNVDHSYSVYARFDANLGRNKQYMAYANTSGDIVLIERDFAYIAP
jgi:hypothetical protein